MAKINFQIKKNVDHHVVVCVWWRRSMRKSLSGFWFDTKTRNFSNWRWFIALLLHFSWQLPSYHTDLCPLIPTGLCQLTNTQVILVAFYWTTRGARRQHRRPAPTDQSKRKLDIFIIYFVTLQRFIYCKVIHYLSPVTGDMYSAVRNTQIRTV